MQKFARCGLITLMLLAAAPLSAHAQDGSPDPVAVGQQFLDNLIAGDFRAATANFTPDVQAALPADKLAEMWQTLPQQVGAYEMALEPQTQPAGEGLTAVIIPLQFARAVLDMQVAVTDAGQIAGLYVRLSAQQPAPTYEPPAYVDQSVFTEQDITLNAGTEWELPGTLTLPVGEGPFPAMVLVHGSGPGDRNETVGANQPFHDLAWGLASHGIAVLRYDKRTRVYGEKMAALQDVTVQQESIDDVVAAVKLLQSIDAILPDGVFVLGHSQGGNLAPRIARQLPNLAGVIMLAAEARPLEDLVVGQFRYLFELDGEITPEEQAQLDVYEAWAEAVKNYQPGAELPTAPGFNLPGSYLLDLRAYDPLATAQQLDVPILILQGERDYQVTMTDFELWQQALAGRENVTFKSYPSLNHLFISGEGPGTPEEYQQPGHVDEAVINDMAGWVLAHAQ